MIYSEIYGRLLRIKDAVRNLTFTFYFRSHGRDPFRHAVGEEYSIEVRIREIIGNHELNRLRNEWMDSDAAVFEEDGEEFMEQVIEYRWIDGIIQKWLGVSLPKSYATYPWATPEIKELHCLYQHLREALKKATSWSETDKILQGAFLDYMAEYWDSLLASLRAEELFDTYVDDPAAFKKDGHMVVLGSNGKHYRIEDRIHGNVVCIEDQMRYCCVLPNVPTYDHWLAQKVIIENSVEEFLTKANAQPVRTDNFDTVANRRLDPLDLYEQMGETDEQEPEERDERDGWIRRLQSALGSREQDRDGDGGEDLLRDGPPEEVPSVQVA